MDIFFMSFRESNAEENWLRTKELHPKAIRLHGIQGIDQIHLLCNQLSKTEFFWTIDGDNYLTKPLTFNYNDIFADQGFVGGTRDIHFVATFNSLAECSAAVEE